METPPRPSFAAYVVSKAALDKLIECWRVEHLSVGFTRVVMGDCVGGEGESMVELGAGWDPEQMAEVMSVWVKHGCVTGNLVDVRDLVDAVLTVLRSGASVPSITIAPRPAA
jgi:hypothetical protein